MKVLARSLAALLCAALMPVHALPASADDGALTRGEAAKMLVAAADDYNPSVTVGDILIGDENGELDLDGALTRAQGLVMLSRAFGTLPEAKGSNKYLAIPPEDYGDIPDWARAELAPVLDAGIVAGVGLSEDDDEHLRNFAPDDAITREQLGLFISRVYRLFGTNERDDFYQTVNRDFLENTVIPEGLDFVSELGYETEEEDVYRYISKIALSGEYSGTAAENIRALYLNYEDDAARNAAGAEPLRKYFDAIDAAGSVKELLNTQVNGFCIGDCFFRFSTTPLMSKEAVFQPLLNTSSMKIIPRYGFSSEDAANLLALCGEDSDSARLHASQAFELSEMLSPTADDIKNAGAYLSTEGLSLDDIIAMAPGLEIESAFARSGLKNRDSIIVSEPYRLIKYNAVMTDAELERLKSLVKLCIAAELAPYLSDEISRLCSYDYDGIEQEKFSAAQFVIGKLHPLVSDIYAAENDVSAEQELLGPVTESILDVYRRRIGAASWLSEDGKQKLIERLNDIVFTIGYKKSRFTDGFDSLRLKTYAEGGSLADNMLAIDTAERADSCAMDGADISESFGESVLPSFVSTASYLPLLNKIEVSTAFLTLPSHEADASYEEILGTVGFVIAHETAHALSPDYFIDLGNGAELSIEDYDAISERERYAAGFFEGCEAGPGLVSDTSETRGENCADITAMSVIDEIAAQNEYFDYAKMYRAYARWWSTVMTRSYAIKCIYTDTHSLNPVRVNRVLQSSDRFFSAFGIREGDGMWLDRSERRSMW